MCQHRTPARVMVINRVPGSCTYDITAIERRRSLHFCSPYNGDRSRVVNVVHVAVLCMAHDTRRTQPARLPAAPCTPLVSKTLHGADVEEPTDLSGSSLRSTTGPTPVLKTLSCCCSRSKTSTRRWGGRILSSWHPLLRLRLLVSTEPVVFARPSLQLEKKALKTSYLSDLKCNVFRYFGIVEMIIYGDLIQYLITYCSVSSIRCFVCFQPVFDLSSADMESVQQVDPARHHIFLVLIVGPFH